MALLGNKRERAEQSRAEHRGAAHHASSRKFTAAAPADRRRRACRPRQEPWTRGKLAAPKQPRAPNSSNRAQALVLFPHFEAPKPQRPRSSQNGKRTTTVNDMTSSVRHRDVEICLQSRYPCLMPKYLTKLYRYCTSEPYAADAAVVAHV